LIAQVEVEEELIRLSGLLVLDEDGLDKDHEWAIRRGFDVAPRSLDGYDAMADAYDALAAEWRRLIAERRRVGRAKQKAAT
jgi:hypothetical protein